MIFFSYVFLPSEIEILSGYQIFWLCCVIVPLLSLSILLSKGQRQLMNVMPAKNEFRLSLIRQSSYLMLTRLIPSACVSLFLFIWYVFNHIADRIGVCFYYGKKPQGVASLAIIRRVQTTNLHIFATVCSIHKMC